MKKQNRRHSFTSLIILFFRNKRDNTTLIWAGLKHSLPPLNSKIPPEQSMLFQISPIRLQ